MYYWNKETCDVITRDVIEKLYDESYDNDVVTGCCETIDQYINRCMDSNGDGSLITVREKYDRVKRELDHKLSLARKYCWDEYVDELADLLSEMRTLEKYL